MNDEVGSRVFMSIDLKNTAFGFTKHVFTSLVILSIFRYLLIWMIWLLSYAQLTIHFEGIRRTKSIRHGSNLQTQSRFIAASSFGNCARRYRM